MQIESNNLLKQSNMLITLIEQSDIGITKRERILMSIAKADNFAELLNLESVYRWPLSEVALCKLY